MKQTSDEGMDVEKREKGIRNKSEDVNCDEDKGESGKIVEKIFLLIFKKFQVNKKKFLDEKLNKKMTQKIRQNGIKMEELINNDGKNKQTSNKNINNDGKANEFFSAIDDELTENVANRILVDETKQILQKSQAPKAKAMHLKEKLISMGRSTIEKVVNEEKLTTEATLQRWTPYNFDCENEVDDRGELLCKEWGRGGFCEINKATKFLFCRKTCLCIGTN
ncbi:hypothetical protein Mgra_00004011 [Meloidogyne graminicola]|uniref:ShKT domain-containing protein n=1 Tax=Meloidogyne graminicola TaxID=189291 RepID=A0A8S9ZTG9_9BILA|nr:hypothetical protein Mgra_00004011 [Meloidogyne graminicola]